MIMTSTRRYVFRFSYLFKKQRRKQNAEGTGNQSRQKGKSFNSSRYGRM